MAITENHGASLRPPRTHRNEFPAEYSLARCSPAERAAASFAGLILHQRIPFAKNNPANGSCRIYSLSHKRAQSNPQGSKRLNRSQRLNRNSLKHNTLKTGKSLS